MHLVWPFDFQSWYERVPGDPSVLSIVAGGMALAGASWWVFRRTTTAEPQRQGALLAAVSYAPASGVFGIHRWTADSYMYFPLMALSLAVVPAVAREWPPRLQSFGFKAVIALLCLLGLLSFANASRWSSSSSLWQGSIERYPDSPLAHQHVGLALRADGMHKESNAIFLQMAERFPAWEDAMDDYVRAYLAAGDPDNARRALDRGVRAGQRECLRIYWMSLLTSPAPPRATERDLVAVAFDKGFEPMKEGLADPAAFLRVAQMLRSLSLPDRAAKAEAHARSIEESSAR
jgi:hypothetical protein